jgi:hypothetical protein
VASNIYGAIALTGGTDGAVDSIKDEVIADGDMCIAIVGGATDACYIYTFDDSSATAESSPDVIKPDNAGGNGRWILCTQVVNNLTAQGNATVAGTLGVTGVLTLTAGLTLGSDLTMPDAGDIVWDNAPASDETHSGDVTSLTAGEILAYGEVCYFKSDGKMWKADADASTTMPVVGMAVAAIAADAAGDFILRGFVRDDTWNWTVGGLIYASTTAGALTQTAVSASGDQLQIVGWAKSADIMYFNPSYDIVEIS